MYEDSLITQFRSSLSTSHATTAKSSRCTTISEDQGHSELLNDILGKRLATMDCTVEKLNASVMRELHDASENATSSLNDDDQDEDRKDRR